MKVNTIVGVAIFIYFIIQLLMASRILLREKNILILTEINEIYRDILGSVIFLALGLVIAYEAASDFLVKTPIYIILTLLFFGGLQVTRKKIRQDIQLGIKNNIFIKYSWFMTRLSGFLLIGAAIFCLLVNIMKNK